MAVKFIHPSDQELLLCADGELSRRRAKMVRDHLMRCWSCRVRMAEIEQIIGDFVRIHHRSFDPRLPPIDGPRASLQMRISAAQPSGRKHWWNLKFLFHPTGLASMCVLTLVLAFGATLKFLRVAELRTGANPNTELLPDKSLTPGAAQAVAMSEICAMERDEVIRPVSTVLQKEVFQEYGLRDAAIDDYEVDYLIPPGLGGTDDIRNLWPEPRYHTTWNSFVKDQLEDYLHQSVCSGKVDLATAQKDVAIDWISAYKKYFKTNEPVGLSSSLQIPSSQRSALRSSDSSFGDPEGSRCHFVASTNLATDSAEGIGAMSSMPLQFCLRPSSASSFSIHSSSS